MSALPIDSQNAGFVSGEYLGKYTDCNGKVNYLTLSLTFNKGQVTGDYQARLSSDTPVVVTGTVEGIYQAENIDLSVYLDQGQAFGMRGSLRTACEHADAAFIGEVENVPGEYSNGTFLAWKGLEVCDIPVGH